jgi:hypothetical protein
MGLNEIAETIAIAIKYCDIQWSLLGNSFSKPIDRFTAITATG